MAYSLENTVELTALANAIRAKTGGSGTMTVSQMTSAVGTISGEGGSGGISSDTLTCSGDISYKFVHDNWTSFLQDYGPYMTFSNILSMYKCFENSMDLTYEAGLLTISTDNEQFVGAEAMFSGCEYLTDIPIFSGRIDRVQSMFSYCKRLRNIPTEKVSGISFTNAHQNNPENENMLLGHSMFRDCYSLRSIPSKFTYSCWDLGNTGSGGWPTRSVNYNQFYKCASLDKIENFYPVDQELHIVNQFSNMVYRCARLSEFKFSTNNAVRSWATQTLDLSGVGWLNVPTSLNLNFYDGEYGDNIYAECPHPITGWNSGITNATKITDATSYEALKDNVDSWTEDKAYSRYNKDSAYHTIQSLPDTSGYLAQNGGTNTIKFTGSAGSATDGGAINTLTSAQIAVATSKGWTVSLV